MLNEPFSNSHPPIDAIYSLVGLKKDWGTWYQFLFYLFKVRFYNILFQLKGNGCPTDGLLDNVHPSKSDYCFTFIIQRNISWVF